MKRLSFFRIEMTPAQALDLLENLTSQVQLDGKGYEHVKSALDILREAIAEKDKTPWVEQEQLED